MKLCFKVKLLQYFYKRNENKAFVLAELIAVIFILGILATVVLPNILFLSQKGCGGEGYKVSEAKNYVASMTKAQQFYYVNNAEFSNSIRELEIGIKTQTLNYNYSTRVTPLAAFNYGISRNKKLKSLVGAVFVVPDNDHSEKLTTVTILCIAKDADITFVSAPFVKNNRIQCGNNTIKLSDSDSIHIKKGEDLELANNFFNYLAAKEYAKAKQITLKIKDPYFKAVTLIAAKDYKNALRVLPKIKDVVSRVRLLKQINSKYIAGNRE